MSEVANDDNPQWEITGPDADGCVWFQWNGPGPLSRHNLGTKEEAGEAFCQWLGKVDYGE